MRRQEEEEEDCIAVVRSETKAEQQRTDISLLAIYLHTIIFKHTCLLCMYVHMYLN